MRDTRAVRLVMEHGSEYPSLTVACEAVARQVGVGKESVRRWVRQAEVDTGLRPGVSTAESEEIRKLKADGIPVRGYVSVVTDCPFDGPTPPANVARVTAALRDLGLRPEPLAPPG